MGTYNWGNIGKRHINVRQSGYPWTLCYVLTSRLGLAKLAVVWMSLISRTQAVIRINQIGHVSLPGGHFWNNCPGALSLSQVTASHFKISHPGGGVHRFHLCVLNLLWPSCTIWQQRSWSNLVQVMACCLIAPNHTEPILTYHQWYPLPFISEQCLILKI